MSAAPTKLEETLPLVFLTTYNQSYACARVISSKGELEYDVCVAFNDREGDGKPKLMAWCNCADWRGYRPGQGKPGEYWCRHAAATLITWGAAR